VKTSDVGSHVSATCILCGRPVGDNAHSCAHCASLAAENLSRVVQLAPEARNVSWGLSGRSESGGSGKPGSRSPGNDDALDALSEVQGTLGTWARHVSEERGGPMEHAGDDPIVHAAHYLLANLTWLAHRAEVDEVFDDIGRCARRLQGLIDGPRAKKYLGPCGAPLEPDWENGDDDPEDGPTSLDVGTCEGDVYGPAGGKSGRCRTCGAEVDQGERRAWLDEQVVAHTADTPLRAKDIAHAIRINVNTIRTWSHTVYDDKGEVRRAAKLSSYWWDGERYVPWVEPREGEDVKARGPRLHYVADVQKLAREAADRRAESEARRERRDTQVAAA
jgi:hypothetical protein